MANLINRRDWMKKAAFSAAGVMGLNSCGTLIYPERRGRTGGRIDPQVVIMDGLLCLLFILPGVVAFGVDFATGAIDTSGGVAGVRRHEVRGRREEDYDAVIAAATGERVGLGDGSLRVVAKEGELSAGLLEQAKFSDGRRPRLVRDGQGAIIRCEVV